VFYDVVEAVAARAGADFTPGMVHLATQKSVSIVTTATIYKRQDANIFAALDASVATLPGIGVYALSALTNARRQDLRDSSVAMVYDYFARGLDPAALLVQAELAAEALLRVIDRIYGSAPGIFGVGEATLGVQVTIEPMVKAAGEDYYEQRVLVRFLVDERDLDLDP
jgi:hypothetical protein